MSLPALFEQVSKIHLAASESSVDQETLRKGCESLKECEEMISKLGLFSSNETKDDISTTNLKYLLVPFYLAELTEKIAQDDRIQILKASQAKLKEFISFCEAKELVPEEELEISTQGGPNSFVDRRAKKIARFKRQKAAESKLLEIKERKERRGRSTKASALSTPIEAGEEDALDDDGEEEREAWLTTFSLALCKAFDLLEMLKKEEEMLSAMKEKQSQAWLTTFSLALCKAFDLLEMLKKEEEMLSAMKEKQSQAWLTTFSLALCKAFDLLEMLKKEEEMLSAMKEKQSQAWLTTFSLALCKAFDLLEMLKKEEEMLSAMKEKQSQAWLTTFSLALCKAFDLLEMLKKEEEMLSAMKEKQSQEGTKEVSGGILDERTKKAEAWHRNAAARVRYTKPAPPITCATFAQDVLEGRANVSQAHEHKHQPMIFGPASLVGGNPTSERERMAAQVFQPHHRLPTMSIEEAGLKEMEIMNKWQERNVKLMEEANSSWYKDSRKLRPGEEEDEDDDAAVEKARAWDDWKDDNPRGAGNKKLTPCG
ncbi:unnamed protein product [Ilex paraguariensis]|uniref:PP2A regulatory subunit TAP46 n=1 Tax=Ilex paraguariensis TaxID=185542 RepID=A0ABC8S5X8_9AQUA